MGLTAKKQAQKNVAKMSKKEGDYICYKVLQVLEKIKYYGNQ